METKRDAEQRITEYYQGLCGSWATNHVGNHSLVLWLVIWEILFSELK